MASYPKAKAKVKYMHMHMCIKTMQGQGQNRTNKTHNVDITLISVQLFAFIKWLLPVLRLTEVTMTGNSLRLARKSTGISHINGLDDLCQGRPSKAKAKDFASLVLFYLCLNPLT